MNVKTCSQCKLEKPADDFRWKNKRTGLRQSLCISCNKEYQRSHYLQNKSDYLRKAKQYRDDYRLNAYKFLAQYFKENPCVDCGETHLAACDFDHVVGDKVANVSALIADEASWTKVLEEIAKCVVRCANCHRKKTARDFGWYKGIAFD